MNKKIFTCLLALVLVAALVIVVAPSAKAEDSNLIIAVTDGSYAITESGKILDLNGQKNVTVNIASGVTLSVIDSTNMELDGKTAGTLTKTGDGKIASVTLYGNYRYLMVENKDEGGNPNGTYSFHPFNMAVTRAGINVKMKTVSLEAMFVANNVVRDMITDFGIKNITKGTSHSAKPNFDFGKEYANGDGVSNNTANGAKAYYDLVGSLEEGALKEVRTFCAYIKINGIDLPILGNQKVDVTPETVLGKISAEYAAGKYSDATKELAHRLYNDNKYLREYLPAMRPVRPTQGEVIIDCDLYALENKQNIVINFADYIQNEGELELTYSVQHNGEDVNLDGTSHTFTFGDYTDGVTYETFDVAVSYMEDGEEQTARYTLKLALRDTTAYRLANGGFENGMEGWTQVGNIGGISSDRNYWLNDPESAEGFAFGMDGDKMFSAYASAELEKNVGTLTSSTFKVGGSGFVTFKVGAMRDENYVYVDVVDANTKQILARYYNGLWQDKTDGVKSGCTLIAYKADLSAFNGKEVFFRISDNADSGYGLFFADSFNTYYETEPEGFNAATPVRYEVSGTIYDLFNGGFEMGNVQGWWNNGEIGLVTNANGYWENNISYNKDGDYLFTGVQSFGADTMREGNKGTLTSSVFEIGGSGYITYMLGGGNDSCYVQVIDSTTGKILARYRQQAREDAVLKKYVADLSAYIGRTVRIQVVDNATFDWGCVSFDNVVTYYETKPDGFTDAIDVKCEIANGSFENGLNGWNMNITAAGAHNTLGWVESSEHDAGWYTKNDGRKDGNNLFTFLKPDGTNCENTMGTLNSSVFTLKQNSYVAFRFGGAGTRDVYMQLCKADGTVIATFYNEAPGKINTEMFAYYYQYTGEEADCFFRVVDNSTSNYGCFVVDDFRVNLESAPEGFIAAIQ